MVGPSLDSRCYCLYLDKSIPPTQPEPKLWASVTHSSICLLLAHSGARGAYPPAGLPSHVLGCRKGNVVGLSLASSALSLDAHLPLFPARARNPRNRNISDWTSSSSLQLTQAEDEATRSPMLLPPPPLCQQPASPGSTFHRPAQRSIRLPGDGETSPSTPSPGLLDERSG